MSCAKRILLLGEHVNNQLSDDTRRCLSAALMLSGPVDILLAGEQLSGIAEQAAALHGVREVLLLQAPWYAAQLPEELCAGVLAMADQYDVFICSATSFGKDLLPRIAGALDLPQVSDVTEILSQDSFMRAVYAGNALEQIQVTVPRFALSVRSSAFPLELGVQPAAAIRSRDPANAVGLSNLIRDEQPESSRPELTSARVVVSGGRGFGSAENFRLLEALADKLGAAIGATRAAVDAGYISNDHQVGQTGKIVAPELYIAVGLSGAIQHIAGMKDSKVIVAVNSDAEAPVFEVADYGIVGDLFTVLPELIEKLPGGSQ